MTLLLALMNPAEAACSLALDDTLHAAPGRDLDITWSGTGSYSHVALTAFDTWGTVHHIQVTANDGHTVWTLPDTLHHDDRLWVHISTAPGGEIGRAHV